MGQQDQRHRGQPDVPADPAQADQPVLRRPSDPDDDPVHDMGGNIGTASMAASGQRPDRTGDDVTAAGGDVAGTPAGSPAMSEEQPPVAASPMDLDDPFATSDGDSAPDPVPRADEYVDIDPPAAGQGGRGADGDTRARLAQRRAEVGEQAGDPARADSVSAAETPPQPDAERMEAALRRGGPITTRDDVAAEAAARRPADVEEGPGTSLA